MLDETKQCKNKKCLRHEVLFEPPPTQKYCLACGSRLKGFFAADLNQQLRLQKDERRSARHTPMLAGFVHGGSAEVSKTEVFVGESNCDVKGCPVAPKSKVEVPWPLFNKWVFLCQQFDVEWIAYLKGKLDEDGVYRIVEDGMYFPEQKATGTHVEAADNSVEEAETIAAVHSHVDMSVFFSGEDEKHFNHPVEFVVNRKGVVGCMVRVKLECGRWQRAEGKVLLTSAQDALNAQDALTAKLTIEPVAIAHYGGGYHSDT